MLFFFVQAYPQTHNDAEIKIALIYNFMKFVSNENLDRQDTIDLAYYGNDPVLTEEMAGLDGEKLKGQWINVYSYTSKTKLSEIDVLFVFNENNYEISDLSKKLKGTNTLLISDRYIDQGDIMINFVHVDEKVQFEVNKKNLNDRGFEVSPKLLLLGGTEVDVRELYRKTEQRLKSERERMAEIEKELNQRKEEVANLIEILSKLHDRNDSLSLILNHQLDRINIQKIAIDSLQNNYDKLASTVDQRKKELKSTTDLLNSKNSQIETLDVQLKQKQKYVENASKSLNNLKGDIAEKEKVLMTQQDRIESQTILLVVLVAFIILIVAFIIYIYGSFKANKKKNMELEKRNFKINAQKEHIQIQANDLVQANRELQAEKNRAENALKKLKNAQSQLVAAEKMVSLGQLTSGIAHEINNPINYISSSIEGLRNIMDDFRQLLGQYDGIIDKYDREKILQIKEDIEYDDLLFGFTELTGNIKLGIDKTKEIVNSLRTFARVDEDYFVLTDLHQNIDSAIILMGKHNKDRIHIVKNYGDIPDVECLPGKMSQVFMNILVNAVQAIENEGEIVIETQRTTKNRKEYVLIKISDNGSGMTEETKKKIFEPFFTTKEVGEGTGLGLSISFSIVKKHKGFIEVESTTGKGTSFLIYIPEQR